MESVSQVNRRKACDLCFVKKIKCDMLKPVCSNCQLYKAECRTTAVRRRVAPARQKPVVASAPVPAAGDGPLSSTESHRINTMESRLERIEAQLQQVLAVATSAMSANATASPAGGPTQDRTPTLSDSSRSTAGSTPNEDRVLVEAGLAQPDADVIDVVSNPSYPPIPPLEEILPTIEDYFTHVNSLLPLFSQAAFMRMLHDYYARLCRHPSAAWAAINIVLALGTRLPSIPSNELDLESDDRRTAKYISNAQSVLSELVTREEDLLGLQVLLGLVLIFSSLKDQRPATVLIGTAVRLAHRLRLHSREHHKYLAQEEALQRNRLFWITYLLDKDISIRHHTPAVQVDADIDLDLPPENPPDDAGNVYTKDGRVKASFFRLRLLLSHIQGRVYDLLLSTRSSKISPELRKIRVRHLNSQLERWKMSVPAELQADAIMAHLGRTGLYWMSQMHFTYLACLVIIHGIWSHNADWRKRISTYSLQALADIGDSNCSKQLPPLPDGWDQCVKMSRDCLSLIYQMPLSDSCLWANGCAYFSGLVILLANNYEFPTHDLVKKDQELTRYSVGIFDKMSDATNQFEMKRLRIVAVELDRRSRHAVAVARAAEAGDTELIAPPNRLFKDAEQNGDLSQETVEMVRGFVTEFSFDLAQPGLTEWPDLDEEMNNAHDIFTIGSEMPELGVAAPFANWADVEMDNMPTHDLWDELKWS